MQVWVGLIRWLDGRAEITGIATHFAGARRQAEAKADELGFGARVAWEAGEEGKVYYGDVWEEGVVVGHAEVWLTEVAGA